MTLNDVLPISEDTLVEYIYWPFMGEPKIKQVPYIEAFNEFMSICDWLNSHNGLAVDGTMVAVRYKGYYLFEHNMADD